MLINERLRNDHAAGSIDRQMQLAPCPTRFGTVFCLQPSARAVDLQPSTADQNLQWSLWNPFTHQAACPTQSAKVARWIWIPSRARIADWRYSGSPSRYLPTTTSATRPDPA